MRGRKPKIRQKTSNLGGVPSQSAPCSSTEGVLLGTLNSDSDLHLFLHLFFTDLRKNKMKCIFSLKMHILNAYNSMICIFKWLFLFGFAYLICIFSFNLHILMIICIIGFVLKNTSPARYTMHSRKIWP